ncbi:MAG: MmcQ/YjbR family DNA-binding protein [Bacilli bacterium]|nr:MmcQ/YjbR family DNA-binding protein [Bacilli bacterium]
MANTFFMDYFFGFFFLCGRMFVEGVSMNYEYDIFKRCIPNYDKLINYGFILKDGKYLYNKKILDGNFELRIVIYNDVLSSKIIDLDFDEEYTNYRIEQQVGEFVNKVREEYLNVLNNIKDNCFESRPFISNQANRIAKMIFDKYGDEPIFKWEDNTSAVFENNSKWYGIIMNVDKSKITSGKGEVEVMNFKIDKNRVVKLLKEKGYYPAYHMNKKSWISVILDDTLKDEVIFDLIEESYSYTVEVLKSNNEWVMPINPGYFDVFNYFDSTDIYYWDKKKSFKKDDIIYLYITKPIGSIMYKCEVEDITEDFTIVRKICKFEEGKYSLDVLKKYGLTSVRSSRHIPLHLSKLFKEDNA